MKVKHLIVLMLLAFSVVFFATCNSDDSGDGTVDGDDDSSYPDGDGSDTDGDQDPSGGCLSIRLYDSQIVPPAGVRVSFNVTTCSGDPVPDLKEDDILFLFDGEDIQSEGGADFELGEEKSIGLYTYLLLDGSQSIVDPPGKTPAFPTMMDAASDFIDVAAEVGQQIGIYMFGSTALSEEVAPFTSDYDFLASELIPSLKDENENRGSTNLYGAFVEGSNKLKDAGSEELTARFLVLFTDGEDETRISTESQALSARGSCDDIMTYVIGLQGDYNEEALQNLSCGEESFIQPQDIDQIRSAFVDVANRINDLANSNYVIGVCSPREGANSTLTMRITYKGMTGEVDIPYDATGFVLAGCESSSIANPCETRQCGPSGVSGVNCGTCPGATDYCDGSGQCVDDCDGRVCGDSPNEGYNCGTCPGATDYCDGSGQCVDDCDGRVCGDSPNEGYNCGTCPGGKICNLDGACVDNPCDPDPCNEHGTCSPSDGSCSCDNDHMTADCGACEYGYTGYPNCIFDYSTLVWQNPPADSTMDWDDAKDYCANLSLDGHSDWRLPTILEFRSLIRGCPGTVTGGACGVTDSCLDSSCWSESDCWSCSGGDGPADGCYWPDEMEGSCGWYRSSSPVEDYDDSAWTVNFGNGHVSASIVNNDGGSVRCVR